jgi:hypothetical protein
MAHHGLVERLGGPEGPRTTDYAAFVTFPALRQRVQTYTRRGADPTSTRTFWRFGLKRRFVATIEWLRLCPNAGFFPQLWQTLAIGGAV